MLPIENWHDVDYLTQCLGVQSINAWGALKALRFVNHNPKRSNKIFVSVLPLDPNRKSVEERVLSIKDFLKQDEEILMMTKDEFISIPERLLSTAVEVVDDS